MRLIGLSAFVFGLAANALAQDDPLTSCTTLSFAPLDVNVPVCTALIGDASALDRTTLGAVYAARAAAYEFALVYHGDHDVTPDHLLAAALADLDEAIALDPRHHAQRGYLLFRLSRFSEAADSYTWAIAAEPARAPARLESRSAALAAAGDHSAAIDDITAAMRLTAAGPDRTRLIVRRAQLREAAGDLNGAIADYRAVIEAEPNHPTAREALQRLGSGTN